MLIQLDDETLAQLQPMPDDWAPTLQHAGKVVKWEARVLLGAGPDAVSLQIGVRAEPDLDAAIAELRRAAWTASELARLGLYAPLAPFRKDRHAPGKRTVSIPSLPAELQAKLNGA